MLLGAEIEAIYFCVKISLWLIAAWVEKKNPKTDLQQSCWPASCLIWRSYPSNLMDKFVSDLYNFDHFTYAGHLFLHVTAETINFQ